MSLFYRNPVVKSDRLLEKMINKHIKAASYAAILGLASANAYASTISLLPVGSTTINLGESVSFEIWADFSDVGGAIGGGLDIFYDSTVLGNNGDFIFDPGFGNDSFISREGDDCTVTPGAVGCDINDGEINAISPNNFNSFAAELSLMGTLSFTGNSAGSTLLTMTDNDIPAGNWFDDSNLINFPEYLGSSVTINAVPVPAAVWPFGSGLVGLVGVARRRAL